VSDWLDASGLPDLSDTSRAALALLQPMEVPDGTVLFSPGETVKGFVIVLRGRVEVFLTGPSGRDILLYEVAPGQSCVQSTLGLMGGDDYSGEAVARGPSRVVLVSRALFLQILDDDPAFRSFVFRAFAQRLQSMMQVLERVAFLRVEARVAEALIARAQDGRVEATHAELATLIGSAREVVSRRLDAFARRGIVELERGMVILRDAEALGMLVQDMG